MFLSGMLAWGRTRVKTDSLVHRIRWLPATFWMGGIFYLSQQSAPPGGDAGAHWSILAHLGLYTGLALLLFWALVGNGGGRLGTPLWALATVTFALTVLYGASDELHQAFIRGRTASEADIAVDAAGATLGIALAVLADGLIMIRRTRDGDSRLTH